ncbi:MAG: aspartate carbamoyltransferase regulatory subunit [Bacteroidaceae bacterium]|nr:aspartate carbamoyltransferase regulatory subunit [Bacteroidaceae bacterium]
MGKTEKKELLVAALENGTVIDHIPSDKVFDVVSLLGLTHLDNPITIGANLRSRKMESKGIIKIADRYFTEEECGKLSVIAPNIVMSIIRDYEVVEKKAITLPDEVHGIVRCGNPKCITNHEPMQTVFHVVDKNAVTLRCRYCGKDVLQKDIKLL